MGPFGYLSRQMFGDIQETEFSGRGARQAEGLCPGAAARDRSTGWFREIETTVFDPASVFLSTQ